MRKYLPSAPEGIAYLSGDVVFPLLVLRNFSENEVPSTDDEITKLFCRTSPRYQEISTLQIFFFDPKSSWIQEPIPRLDHLLLRLPSRTLEGTLPSLPDALTADTGKLSHDAARAEISLLDSSTPNCEAPMELRGLLLEVSLISKLDPWLVSTGTTSGIYNSYFLLRAQLMQKRLHFESVIGVRKTRLLSKSSKPISDCCCTSVYVIERTKWLLKWNSDIYGYFVILYLLNSISFICLIWIAWETNLIASENVVENLRNALLMESQYVSY